MESSIILLENVNQIHTTEMGFDRIRKNIGDNIPMNMPILEWCKRVVLDKSSIIVRQGKNWYIHNFGIVLTINSYNYCIITAHKDK